MLMKVTVLQKLHYLHSEKVIVFNMNDFGAFVGNAVNFCQTDKQDTMSIKWQSETCAVDVSMCGLWSSKVARDTDIHCVAVNPDRSLVAVGDSRGQISLFRYPCFRQGVSDDKLVKESIVELFLTFIHINQYLNILILTFFVP